MYRYIYGAKLLFFCDIAKFSKVIFVNIFLHKLWLL